VYRKVYDLSSICDTLNTSNKVCYGFQHTLATWCIHWSYPFKQMCTQMGHHFSYLIWGTIWRMNPLFTSGICDNLFTKHSTHMAYISKPLVRKLFKFEIFQTILRNRYTLISIFSRAVCFILQTSSDVIDLSCVFYPTIF